MARIGGVYPPDLADEYWAAFKLFGFTAITFLFVLSQMPLIMRHSLEEQQGKRSDAVSSPPAEALRALYKQPHDRAVSKEIRALDHHCRTFIANSPFVLIGSSDGNGNADVTPKGDRPGFVAVLDDLTLAIPDRPGNNRLDTFENVLANPAVGLLFLIPGMNETLRVNGDARLTADPGLRERLAVDGRLPHRGDAGHGQVRLHALRQGLHALRICGSRKAGPTARPADARPDPRRSLRNTRRSRRDRQILGGCLHTIHVVKVPSHAPRAWLV